MYQGFGTGVRVRIIKVSASIEQEIKVGDRGTILRVYRGIGKASVHFDSANVTKLVSLDCLELAPEPKTAEE